MRTSETTAAPKLRRGRKPVLGIQNGADTTATGGTPANGQPHGSVEGQAWTAPAATGDPLAPQPDANATKTITMLQAAIADAAQVGRKLAAVSPAFASKLPPNPGDEEYAAYLLRVSTERVESALRTLDFA